MLYLVWVSQGSLLYEHYSDMAATHIEGKMVKWWAWSSLRVVKGLHRQKKAACIDSSSQEY